MSSFFETVIRAGFRYTIIARHIFRKWFPVTPPDDWTIVRVYAFCEDFPTPARDFADLTREVLWEYKVDEDTLKDIVDDCLGWKKYKIEIRYMCRGKKFRCIVREYRPFTFPPCSKEELSKISGLHSPNGILLSAQLYVQGEIEEPPLDVTAKLKKYQGVMGNFHGTEMYCHDLFPFDDNKYNAERFGKLVVYRLSYTRGIDVKTFDFSDNDLLTN